MLPESRWKTEIKFLVLLSKTLQNFKNHNVHQCNTQLHLTNPLPDSWEQDVEQLPSTPELEKELDTKS